MADIPADDAAGQDTDLSDSHVAVLAGTASGDPRQPRGATTVLEAEPAEQPAAELPVWSFPATGYRAEATPAEVPVDQHQVELPLVTSAATPSPGARPQPLFGPIGTPRSAALVVILSVVTLGIYALVWHHRVNRELEEFDPKLHARPRRSTVAVGVPWLAGLLFTVAGAIVIVGARLAVQVPFAHHVTTTQAWYMLAGLAVVPYLTLMLPFSIVAVVMTLERLRCVEEHVGTTTDRQVRPVGGSLLLAIPVIGGLALIGVVQRRVNAVWDAVAPSGRLPH